jgi:hypothetical protein
VGWLAYPERLKGISHRVFTSTPFPKREEIAYITGAVAPIDHWRSAGGSVMRQQLDPSFDSRVIAQIRAYHDEALALMTGAIHALLVADQATAEHLLGRIDTIAIRREQAWLRQVGLEGVVPTGLSTRGAARRNVPDPLKHAVTTRDGFCCQFTGLRLLDPDIGKCLGTLTESFPWHPNYAMRDTASGRAGHPMTRTHSAAFEHAHPHSFGGAMREDNIILTSMELNEAKGVRMPSRVAAGQPSWDGLREFLPQLYALVTAHPGAEPLPMPVILTPSLAKTRATEVRVGASRRNSEAANDVDLRVGALYSMRIAAHKLARRWRVDALEGDIVTLLELCWTAPGVWVPQRTVVRESREALAAHPILLLANPAPEAGSRVPLDGSKREPR